MPRKKKKNDDRKRAYTNLVKVPYEDGFKYEVIIEGDTLEGQIFGIYDKKVTPKYGFNLPTIHKFKKENGKFTSIEKYLEGQEIDPKDRIAIRISRH